jgi:aminoglycoside phosphotransferase (APT) family kinase protein
MTADPELVDTEKLARWMDERRLPGSGMPLEARFVTGGASNELFEIRRGEARMALRRPPRKVPPGRNESMLREYRVLAALADTDVPHARVLAVGDDPSVLGACFYVMEYVDGWSCMSTEGWPAPFDADLDQRRGLAWELVDAIAKLASVDWRKRGLEGFGKPDGFHERQVDRWLGHLAGFRFRELPGIDEAADWLRRHKPRSYRPGILHGDYQFANVMFRHGAPAQLAAIVDWEMGTVGDPKLDLAWMIQRWPEDTSAPEAATAIYVELTGMPSRSQLLAHYAEVSGRQVDDIDYYLVLAKWKLAIVLEQGFQRAGDDVKLRAFGPLVLKLMQEAAELSRTTEYHS